MTQTFEGIWAGVAEHDLKDIVAFSAADSPANTLKIVEKIKQKVSSLSTLPEQGRPVPELYEQGILICEKAAPRRRDLSATTARRSAKNGLLKNNNTKYLSMLICAKKI